MRKLTVSLKFLPTRKFVLLLIKFEPQFIYHNSSHSPCICENSNMYRIWLNMLWVTSSIQQINSLPYRSTQNISSLRMNSSVVRTGILLLDFKLERVRDVFLILILSLLILTLASYYGTEIGSEEVLAQIISSADH